MVIYGVARDDIIERVCFEVDLLEYVRRSGVVLIFGDELYFRVFKKMQFIAFDGNNSYVIQRVDTMKNAFLYRAVC